MPLTSGSRLGPYSILAPLGAGGMGEVYRAHDTTLNRDVAIKVLPAAFAQDRERVARFRREAQVLASLNHPNVAGIYGLEERDGEFALALEFVDGEDLAERLGRGGAIPGDQAVSIARQIAEGLEAAHERGIVHRDLKPANIKLTTAGGVKILDFGLAKAYEGDTPEASAHSPTLTRNMTDAGLILGTAAYMSPEQARGTALDKRTDIWAFGVVLFEMLTGRLLFDGGTVSDILAGVLRQEIDLAALPVGTPAGLRTLLARCLERDPKQRLRDIGEARVLLSGRLDAPAQSSSGARRLRGFPLVASAAMGACCRGDRRRDPGAPPARRDDRLLRVHDAALHGGRSRESSGRLLLDGPQRGARRGTRRQDAGYSTRQLRGPRAVPAPPGPIRAHPGRRRRTTAVLLAGRTLAGLRPGPGDSGRWISQSASRASSAA